MHLSPLRALHKVVSQEEDEVVRQTRFAREKWQLEVIPIHSAINGVVFVATPLAQSGTRTLDTLPDAGSRARHARQGTAARMMRSTQRVAGARL